MKLDKKKKRLAVIIIAICLCLVAVGGIIAYLIDISSPMENIFTPVNVKVEINEDFNEEVKKDVTVKNIGNTDAYIRAAIVVNWQNDKGQVLAKDCVAGTDYTVTFAEGTNWAKSSTDGYWYFKKPVAADNSTDILIKECAPVADKVPEGYHLSVEILAESLQTSVDAVNNAWKLSIASDGTLIVG